ncbi:MAG: single-stranded DNA-binding protein [Oscillospiraceae bacterium]|jgi:single-strand DNA-binding protein|nr:single-stranded DNA-binding protein [Oscillospiraceae bacterium]
MLNKVILMGRLVKDPELRHTQTGTAVTSFRIAVDRDFKRQGEDTADFLDIVAWDKKAEFASRYFNKGKLVAVTGRLQQRNWTDKDGNKRNSVEVIAEELHFAESRRSEDGHREFPPPHGEPLPAIPATPSAGFHELEDDDGELPF